MGPWLIAGLVVAGGLLLFASSSSAASQGSSSWPPSAAVQTSLYQQLVQYMTNAYGYPPTAQDQTDLQAVIAGAPSVYVSKLSAGQLPSVAQYQAWFWNAYVSGLQSSGLAPGYPDPSQLPTGLGPGYTS